MTTAIAEIGRVRNVTMEHQQLRLRLHGTTAHVEAVQLHTRGNGSPESCQIDPSATCSVMVLLMCRRWLYSALRARVELQSPKTNKLKPGGVRLDSLCHH